MTMGMTTLEGIMEIVIPLFILAIPVFVGFGILFNRIVKRRRAMEHAHHARRGVLIREWQALVDSLASPCERCGKVAHPIPASGDRYGCPACHHSFVGKRHDIPVPPGP
jgi:hypothetical protein